MEFECLSNLLDYNVYWAYQNWFQSSIKWIIQSAHKQTGTKQESIIILLMNSSEIWKKILHYSIKRLPLVLK